MLLASRLHTAGDIKRWQIDYSAWLDNAASIISATLTSSSTTCTVTGTSILGPSVIFFLNGGVSGETAVISVAMRDSFDNVKNDTLSFLVVAP